MAKKPDSSSAARPLPTLEAPEGGETHQTAAAGGESLTTNQGIVISTIRTP
jgi:hypothetical protein